MMMIRFLILFLGFLIIAGFAHAHSPLKTTSPAANETLASMPESIELTFAKAARLTKVTLTQTSGHTKRSERLALPSKKFITKMNLTPMITGAGDYTVDWRALSEDGHAIKGSFGFTIAKQ